MTSPPPSPPPQPDSPECPVCLEPYTTTTTIPLVLPCGHSTCSTCLTHLFHLSTLSPPNTLNCPSCTQLVSFHTPSSLPKNIDLLRFALPSPKPSLKIPTQRRLTLPLSPRIFSHHLYTSWKDWILPSDVVLSDDSVFWRIQLQVSLENELIRCRLRDDQKVRLVEIGRFVPMDEVFEFSYLSKVMSALNCMSDAQRSVLMSVFRVSVRVSRVCRVLGLWLDDESGCLYLVSERMSHGLLGLNVGKQVWRDFLRNVGVELCEIFISLRKEGFVCGCFGLSCVCFDEFGRVHVDLSEVLVKGREISECVTRELDFVRKFSNMDMFVIPEVMLELFSWEGIQMEKNRLNCGGYYGSDVWLLACVLLMVIIGNEFGEGICSYLKAVLEGVTKSRIMHTKFVNEVKTSLETTMGSESSLLREMLVKCLDYSPEQRPYLTDVWKNMKALNDCQYMSDITSFNMALMKEDVKLCLALSELCITSSSARSESNTSNLNKERSDSEVDPSEAGEVKVDDFVESLAAGKLKCKDLIGHLDCITGFCVGGDFLFSSSFDKTVNVWSLQDFTHVHTFKGHEHRVMALVFVDQEKPLCVSADSGGGIFVWHVIQPFVQKPLKKWCEEKDWRYSGIHALAFSDSGYLYTGSGDRLIKAWSLTDHTLLCSMEGHKSVVSTLALSNGVLYSGSWDGTVRLWSLHDHSPLTVFGEDTPGIVSSVLCLYTKQNVIIAAYDNGHLKIWMNSVLKSSQQTHNGAALALAMEGNWFFSGGWDKTLKVQEIKRAGDESDYDSDILNIGSIACDSVITALMYVQGILFVGYANKLIKAFHRSSFANHGI